MDLRLGGKRALVADLTAGTGSRWRQIWPSRGPGGERAFRGAGGGVLLDGPSHLSAAKVHRFRRGVAEVVAFVCSPASSATSGASLRADGGIVRTVV